MSIGGKISDLQANRLRELAAIIDQSSQLPVGIADGRSFRTLVQGIDTDTEAIRIIFRVTQNTRGSGSDSIAVTLPRP
jgi:hypothetical protein